MNRNQYKAKIASLRNSREQLTKLYKKSDQKDIAADTAILVISSLINAEEAAFKTYKGSDKDLEEGELDED